MTGGLRARRVDRDHVLCEWRAPEGWWPVRLLTVDEARALAADLHRASAQPGGYCHGQDCDAFPDCACGRGALAVS